MDKYQTIGARFLALIIDSILTIFLIGLLFMVYGSFSILPSLFDYLGGVLITVIPTIYTVSMHARYGQTLGKMAAKVKVLDVAETSINLGQAVIRSLPQIIPLFLVIGFSDPQLSSETDNLYMRYITGISTGLIWIWNIIDIIVALSTEKHRALHDYIAGTVVVKI